MFLCCSFSVALGTNWPGSRGPLRDWKPGPGPCDWRQLYSHLSCRDNSVETQMPIWVFLLEPHMARAVAICRVDPLAVDTSGPMHSPTRAPLPPPAPPSCPSFPSHPPTLSSHWCWDSAVSDPVLNSSRVPSVSFPILPCTLQPPKVGKNLNHAKRLLQWLCVCVCVRARVCVCAHARATQSYFLA